MMKVEITPKALEDLEDLREHLDEEFGKKKEKRDSERYYC